MAVVCCNHLALLCSILNSLFICNRDSVNIPGTGAQFNWFSAIALVNGAEISTSPETDEVYVVVCSSSCCYPHLVIYLFSF
jgi:hypothetical protein